MDEAHCVIAVIEIEVAKFNIAADRTPLQRLSYMSAAQPSGLNDGAKIQIKTDVAK